MLFIAVFSLPLRYPLLLTKEPLELQIYLPCLLELKWLSRNQIYIDEYWFLWSVTRKTCTMINAYLLKCFHSLTTLVANSVGDFIHWVCSDEYCSCNLQSAYYHGSTGKNDIILLHILKFYGFFYCIYVSNMSSASFRAVKKSWLVYESLMVLQFIINSTYS